MRRLILLLAVLLAGCAQLVTEAETPAGQLFCSLALGGGASITAAIIDAAASAVPGAGEVAVIATGAADTAVQADCAAAAKATNALAGVPVSPPAAPAAAPKIAIPAAS